MGDGFWFGVVVGGGAIGFIFVVFPAVYNEVKAFVSAVTHHSASTAPAPVKAAAPTPASPPATPPAA